MSESELDKTTRAYLNTVFERASAAADRLWQQLAAHLNATIEPCLLRYLDPKITDPRPSAFAGDIAEALMRMEIPGHEEIVLDCHYGVKPAAENDAEGDEAEDEPDGAVPEKAWTTRQYFVKRTTLVAHQAKTLDSAILMARELYVRRSAAEAGDVDGDPDVLAKRPTVTPVVN